MWQWTSITFCPSLYDRYRDHDYNDSTRRCTLRSVGLQECLTFGLGRRGAPAPGTHPASRAGVLPVPIRKQGVFVLLWVETVVGKHGHCSERDSAPGVYLCRAWGAARTLSRADLNICESLSDTDAARAQGD